MASVVENSTIVVRIEEGFLRGKTVVNEQCGVFFSFQGIPYAEPPIGPLRFKAPQPVKPWLGIKDATVEGNESISKHMITRSNIGLEDCLTLNVYTSHISAKDDESSGLKPVMFWIHGGLFISGSGKSEQFGPEFLLAEDIVLVTINYRLGILGFLRLEDETLEVPGNAGLKDMAMALQWTRRNIKRFSGDPNNITVFGQSAGAAAAHLLTLSPMTKGLIHKVILQSSCAMNNWIYGKQITSGLIAGALNLSNPSDKELLEVLKNLSAEKIFEIQIQLFRENHFDGDIEHRIIGITVDKSSTEEVFMPDLPINLIRSGAYANIPMIMGYNTGEGLIFDSVLPKNVKEIFYSNFEYSVPRAMQYKIGSAASKAAAEKIREFYFGSNSETKNKEKYLQQITTLFGDTNFVRDMNFCLAELMHKYQQPIYLYRMTIETELNLFKKLIRATGPGPCHGDELGYLFKNKYTPHITKNSLTDIAQKRFVKMWTNFAKFGNPTPDTSDSLLKVSWTPVTKNQKNYLDIGYDLRMGTNPDSQRMQFWSNFFNEHQLSKAKL